MADSEYTQLPIQFEEWRPVNNFAGLYEVSNLGRVRSLDRHVRSKNNSTMIKHGHILVPEIAGGTYTRNGRQYHRSAYARVLFTVGKKQTHHSVHHLVLEAFVGPRPSPRHQANHKSGDKIDNRVENLEWVTPSENQLHAFHVLKTGAINYRPMYGAQNNAAKEIDVPRIHELKSHGMTQRAIAKLFGLHEQTISDILHRRGIYKNGHWSERISN